MTVNTLKLCEPWEAEPTFAEFRIIIIKMTGGL